MDLTPLAPPAIRQLLEEHFDALPIVQVGTCDDQGPVIRSMGMFALMEDRCPLLITHTGSRKWHQLTERPDVSLCCVNASKTVQIVVRGRARLHDKKTSLRLLDQYWPQVPDAVWSVYAQPSTDGEYAPPRPDQVFNGPPDAMGLIEVIPWQWETLIFDLERYVDSQRVRYEVSEGQWQAVRWKVG